MDKQIKIANRQFYKYWKRLCKEVCARKPFVYCIYRTLCACSLKVRKPIYQIVKMLLDDDNEEKCSDDVRGKLGIHISDKEVRAVLFFAGYKRKKTTLDTYYINSEMKKRLHNVCVATADCINSGVPLTIMGKIQKKKYDYYEYKRKKYLFKRDAMSLDFNCTAYEVEPANGERANRFKGTVQTIMTVVLFLLFLFVIIMAVKVNIMDTGSSDTVKTFWNAILGASIPGIATIFTTNWLINHEYKVDYHSERMGALPVLSMIHEVDKSQLLNEDGSWSKEISSSRKLNTSEVDNMMDVGVDIFKITNKGRGMAFDVTHDRTDEVFTFGDIAQEETVYIALRKYRSLEYVFHFMDIYGNRYSQRFCMKNEDDICEISSYPPVLVLRTRLIRYQQ